MAIRKLLWKCDSLWSPFSRACTANYFKPFAVSYSQKVQSKNELEADDADSPVKFTSSKAAEFDSEEDRTKGHRTNHPKEESDWDRSIGENIYDKVPDLELVVLRDKRKKASFPGSDPFTEADKQRLQELELQLLGRRG